jgi:hypothetical protein
MTSTSERTCTQAASADQVAHKVIAIVARALQGAPDFQPTLMTQMQLGRAREEIAALLLGWETQIKDQPIPEIRSSSCD